VREKAGYLFTEEAILAIQQGSGSVACASQQATALQAPVTPGDPAPVGGAWIAAGTLPVVIPNSPNPVFGTPRTVLNPRQLQFAAKFTF
jgi:hypothetical protein